MWDRISSHGRQKRTNDTIRFVKNNTLLGSLHEDSVYLRAMIGQSRIIFEETSLLLFYSILSRLLLWSFCKGGVDKYVLYSS